MIRLFQTSYFLMIRALKEALRQPGYEAPNFIIPVFFFLVIVGAIGHVSNSFGVSNYTGFQMPVAILQGVAAAAGAAGLGMVTDIERGYFEKLLVTPAPRLSLVLGRFVADGIRVIILTIAILAVGLILGSGMATGFFGAAVLVLLAGAFGLAYTAIGMAIALKTGSTQAANLGFIVFFPLLFLSPAFAPIDVFSGWLKFLATLNPVTYVLDGMRSLVLDGWQLAAIGKAIGGIAILAVITWSATLWALRSRTK